MNETCSTDAFMNTALTQGVPHLQYLVKRISTNLDHSRETKMDDTAQAQDQMGDSMGMRTYGGRFDNLDLQPESQLDDSYNPESVKFKVSTYGLRPYDMQQKLLDLGILDSKYQ